ncbi:type II secretion system protein [Clostridium estertheticum]|uniref:type II secretion system protein n=1 Tax=Clostridium estertheticum TaxID=238834 RepID=UPI001C0DD75A|nr:prepilin-type N-terminal cleavage/methylation domain-containing protein [Clostridium estertheticum]MBU3072791.1 prepilin-type N-terminal cleavage/methylation domain-containing protein [Clostridium estertheticum]MBU3163172.1 prepilin-type N-terminal cleavage/methylation domain-containing protein [Clostridium estertheticum]
MKNIFSQRGFTLLEEIVSMAIISIIVVTFLPIIINSLKNVHTSGNRTLNVSSAENKVGNAIKKNAATPVNSNISIELKNSSGETKLSSGVIKGYIFTVGISDDNKTTLSTYIPGP